MTPREWRDFQRYEKILGTKILKGEIPTLQEVRLIKNRGLARMIADQAIHESAADLLKMMNDLDERTLASKLLSICSPAKK